MKVFHRIILYEEVKDEEKIAERTTLLFGSLKSYGISEYLLTISKPEEKKPEQVEEPQEG